MKKLRRVLLAAGAAALVLLAAFVGLGSLRWRPGRGPEPARLEHVARGQGTLLAGAAELPIPLPAGVPVAGFPRLAWANEGVRDAVAVRALVVSEAGCSVALVSAEILLVPGALGRAVERRVRDLDLDGLVVAGTHTHAGPGGFWRDALAERIGTGPYDRRFFDALADRMAEAVRAAAAARRPARLAVARGSASALARNRAGGKVDGRLLVARLTAESGETVARVVVFPAHATFLGPANRRISGDWPGELMRGLSASGGTTLFFQGAMGDQSPSLANGSAPGPAAYGHALAARVRALSYGSADDAPPLAAATASVVLPPPDVGASPPLLKRLASNLLYDWVPARARVTAVRLGAALLLATPGEPVAEVGRRWRAEAGDVAEVVALAGDYLGYIETSERMAEQLGETQRTYYGPELAERLGDAVAVAARAAMEPPPSAAPDGGAPTDGGTSEAPPDAPPEGGGPAAAKRAASAAGASAAPPTPSAEHPASARRTRPR